MKGIHFFPIFTHIPDSTGGTPTTGGLIVILVILAITVFLLWYMVCKLD